MIDHYDWSGGREAMLRFGPDAGPVVVAALPLFEEANRTRAFVVTILRALAERGIASALPDLPGQGESLVPLEEVSGILMMQTAYECAVAAFDRTRRNCYALSLRSGALLDTLGMMYGRWHLAPIDGQQVFRELTRLKQAELGKGHRLVGSWWFDDVFQDGAEDAPIPIAGNLVSTGILTDLKIKEPFSPEDADLPRRIVRLDSDPQPADLKLPGAPLWRRSEPDNDPALAALLADDIAAWVRACES